MKKITILIILASCFLIGKSQKIYIKGKAGYSFNVRSDIWNRVNVNETFHYEENEVTNEYPLDSISDNSLYQIFPVSFGKGSRLGGSIGYEFSKNFGVELGVEYFKSKELTNTNTAQVKHDFGFISFFEKEEYEYLYNAKMISFHPEVYIKTENEKFSPFVKLGMIIARVSNTIHYGSTYDTDVPYWLGTYASWELANAIKTSFGFSFASGIDIKLANGLYVFTELKYSNVVYSPQNGELTSYLVAGENYLESLPASERYVEYVDEYYSSENRSDSNPSKELKPQFIFDNLAIYGGLKVVMWDFSNKEGN